MSILLWVHGGQHLFLSQSGHLWYSHKTRSWSNKAISNQTSYMGKQRGHKNVESATSQTTVCLVPLAKRLHLNVTWKQYPKWSKLRNANSNSPFVRFLRRLCAQPTSKEELLVSSTNLNYKYLDVEFGRSSPGQWRRLEEIYLPKQNSESLILD